MCEDLYRYSCWNSRFSWSSSFIRINKESKKVCIANKECFVSAGSLIVSEAKKYEAQI